MSPIHPTAVIDRSAELGPDVEIGPYAVIGPRVTVGAGSALGPHAVIERNTVLGERCFVGSAAVLGSDPQDAGYRGEETWLAVGSDTRIREHATLHRASRAGGRTRVGERCFIMTYAHVAHDCVLEDDVTLANAVQLGGHVRVEAAAGIGGASAVHQFVRIGTRSFVGGGSSVRQDIPPYARAAGNPLRIYGINAVGLRRAGMSRDARLELQRAFRLIFNSRLTTSEALEQLRLEAGESAEVRRVIEFFERTERGVLV